MKSYREKSYNGFLKGPDRVSSQYRTTSTASS